MDEENIANRLILKSPEAKKYHDEVYYPKREEGLKKIRGVVLSVLVWGPGTKGQEEYQQKLYKKRVEIINNLRGLGLDAFTSEEETKEMKKEREDVMTFSSSQTEDKEDIINGLIPKSEEAENHHENVYHPQREEVCKKIYGERINVNNISLQALEYLQASPEAVVLIIDIAASQGSRAEIHDFAKNKDIAPKMVAFFDRQKTKGYSNSVIPIFEASGGQALFFDYSEDPIIWKKVEERVRALQFLTYLKTKGFSAYE